MDNVRRTFVIAAFVTLCLLLQACGGIMRARYYEPALVSDGSIQEEWGDGLAVALPTHCMWLYAGSLSDDIMWAGPLFLPFFPIGAAAERIGGPMEQGNWVFVNLLLIPPKDTATTSFTLKPEAITMEFDNGESLKPGYFRYAHTTPEWELRSGWAWTDPGDPPPQKGFYRDEFHKDFEIDGWARIGMSFMRPGDDVHSTALRIRDLKLPDGNIADYDFALSFIEKRRYVRAGKHQNNEPMSETAARACLELMDAG